MPRGIPRLTALCDSDSGSALRPVWSGIGVHREAEFAKSHAPAFMRGEAPCNYVCRTGYAYQWEDCNSAGNNCSPIAGATGQI
jgi:hypothetical protein